jgi:signal transduction histidine kinase
VTSPSDPDRDESGDLKGRAAGRASAPHARPVALADLVQSGALDDIIRTLAEHHGIGLGLADCDGALVVSAGPLELSAKLLTHPGPVARVADGKCVHITPLVLDSRLYVGPCAYGPDGAKLATHVGRLVGRLVVSAHERHLDWQRHQTMLAEAWTDLADKSQRLTAAVERIQESDRLKTGFLATMSHELRTPLTSVIGYSEMLLEGLAGRLSREQRDYVQIIMEKGDQLLQLITGLLDASRMEAGTLRLRREPVDLGETLAGIVAVITPVVRRKRLELRVDVHPQTPRVDGDREKLRQVLTHLLGNAVKFTPDGGQIAVTISSGTLDRFAVAEAAAGRPAVRLRVADSGIGIAAEKQQRIFEPFFQVDSSSTREYGGTGLGLALVKSYVEALGGHVWVESELGRGSAFTVTLPSVQTDDVRAAAGQA